MRRARTGNWSVRNGVGFADNIYQYEAADDTVASQGASFSQDYAGLRTQQGLTSAEPTMDWTNYQAATAGPTAGAGGGDYSVGASSVAKAAADRLARI